MDDFSKYFYDGKDVLKNLLNIYDNDMLQLAENYFVEVRLMDLADKKTPYVVDYDYYQYLHKLLFQDVYEWAGEITPGKEETLKNLIDNANRKNWGIMSKAETSRELSELLKNLYNTGAFFKGVTKTSLIFLEKFCESHGLILRREVININLESIIGFIKRDKENFFLSKILDAALSNLNNPEMACNVYLKGILVNKGYLPTNSIMNALNGLNKNLPNPQKIVSVQHIFDLFKNKDNLNLNSTKYLTCVVNDLNSQYLNIIPDNIKCFHNKKEELRLGMERDFL